MGIGDTKSCSVLVSYGSVCYGSAATRLWIGFVAEAEFATLLVDAVVRAVHYGPLIFIGYKQMIRASVSRGALLRVPGYWLVGGIVLEHSIFPWTWMSTWYWRLW